jgi:hypothetical protein
MCSSSREALMPHELADLQEKWRRAWPGALAFWSRFTQLSEPHWCFTIDEERNQELLASFAMIRLLDHTVVISLRQVREHKLEDFATEVLAHEIGHHVYCPADLSDNARLLAHIRAGLPTKEQHAPIISNLYTDLLINDRLQRGGMNISGVYERLIGGPSKDRMWTLYMRMYEILWNLPRTSLAKGAIDQRLNFDAMLGARLIRSYAKDWLDGGGRFACLCLPYIIDDDGQAIEKSAGRWHDTRQAGNGGLPDGLAEFDEDERAGAIHPAEDPELSGVDADQKSNVPEGPQSIGRQKAGGQKSLKTYRQPFEYADVLKAAGVNIPEEELIARYYRERALPHLVKSPVRENPTAMDPTPEGLDAWDLGSPLEEVDWMGTVLASPYVVPGVTTRQRLFGTSPGTSRDTTPIDLYLGVDCSGSMGNPAANLSYPVLAGAIIALSALRSGSRVKVVLSGEPGRTISTDGFLRDETLVLKTLTSYLGTGTTFGIHRLAETFANFSATARPVHILIVTDNDIFSLLDNRQNLGDGWKIAQESRVAARGGGTYVLQLPQYLMNQQNARSMIHPGCNRMKQDGWNVANVNSMEELVEFARQFSQSAYGGNLSSQKQGAR